MSLSSENMIDPLTLNSKFYGSKDKINKPVLIIMHGLLGSLDNWHSLAMQFGDSFNVYSVDLRNHGKSPHSSIFSYEAMVGDVVAFMDNKGIYKANVIGHSMGAKVAMFLAYMKPDRIQKLIPVDMAPFYGKGNHDEIFKALNMLDLKHYTRRSEIDKDLAEYISQWGVRQFLLKNLERVTEPNGNQSFKWKMNLQGIEMAYDNIRIAIPESACFKGETLFVRGGASNYIKESEFSDIQKLFPNATLRTIEGVGHWVHAENPKAFYEICNDFLKDV